jgi:hypothetical protein
MASTFTVSTSEVEALGTKICRDKYEGTDRQTDRQTDEHKRLE